MSAAYEGKDLNELAAQAERDLANRGSKGNTKGSDSKNESGIDTGVENKFPPGVATAEATASAGGRGGNAPIPVEEGGVRDDRGRLSKAKQFENEVGKGAEDDLERKDDKEIDVTEKPT